MVLSAFLGGGIVVLESFKIQVLASHFVKKPAVDFVVLRIKSVKQLLNQMYIGVLLISCELSEIPCGWLRNLLALYDWDIFGSDGAVFEKVGSTPLSWF